MAPPTFINLPFEIRTQIYRYAISDEAEIDLRNSDASGPGTLLKELKQSYNERASLLLTNKQINVETSHFKPTVVSVWVCCPQCFGQLTGKMTEDEIRLISFVKVELTKDALELFGEELGTTLQQYITYSMGVGGWDFKVLSIIQPATSTAKEGGRYVEVVLEVLGHQEQKSGGWVHGYGYGC